MRVGQGECRPPRSAEHHPPLDVQEYAQLFDVGEQMVGRVDRQVGSVGDMRSRPTAPPLVEHHDAVGLRIEEPALLRRRTAARPAVQEHDRLAVRVSADLPIHLLIVTDREETVVVRFDRRIGLATFGHRLEPDESRREIGNLQGG